MAYGSNVQGGMYMYMDANDSNSVMFLKVSLSQGDLMRSALKIFTDPGK